MTVQYFRFEAQCRPCSDPPLLVFASAPLVVLVNLPWDVLFILPLIIWVEFRRVWLPTSCLGNCRVSHLRLLHLVPNSLLSVLYLSTCSDTLCPIPYYLYSLLSATCRDVDTTAHAQSARYAALGTDEALGGIPSRGCSR